MNSYTYLMLSPSTVFSAHHIFNNDDIGPIHNSASIPLFERFFSRVIIFSTLLVDVYYVCA